MKALIVEDEPLVAKDLKKLALEAQPGMEILAILPSVEETVAWLRQNPAPDLIFLDIQLSDGTSFDIFEQISVPCPVIFTTAYDDYAIRAFKVNSLDYLLKPIDRKELGIALEKYRWSTASGNTDIRPQIQALLTQLAQNKPAPAYKERFLARQGKLNVVVAQRHIACFLKDVLVYILTTDKQQLVTDFETLDALEDLLDPKFFFRANRQTFVNIEAVESYRADSYGKLIVKIRPPVQLTVDISREKAQGFKNWLAGGQSI